jgi:hypothetical protein
MLDAVAGYIVKRIRSKHLAAVSQPSHILSILQSYARLSHVSVVIPELIGALSEQVGALPPCGWEKGPTATGCVLCFQVVAGGSSHSQPPIPTQLLMCGGVQICQAALEATCTGQDSHPEALPPPLTISLVSQLLHSQLQLGYQPPPRQLLSLLPAVAGQVQHAGLTSIVELLSAAGQCRFQPGRQLMGQLLAQAAAQRDQLDQQSSAQLLFACAQLGWDGGERAGSAVRAMLEHAADLVALSEAGDGLGLTDSCRWGLG